MSSAQFVQWLNQEKLQTLKASFTVIHTEIIGALLAQILQMLIYSYNINTGQSTVN